MIGLTVSSFLTCMIDHYTQVSYYSQLLPCRHLAITDTALMRTVAKSLLNITDTTEKKLLLLWAYTRDSLKCGMDSGCSPRTVENNK